jgi:hypothetical protein
MPPARRVEMDVEHVDAEHVGAWIALGEPRRDLAGAAAAVEDARVFGNPVAIEQSRLLRPDAVGLRGERPHHRLVRHLLGLGIEVGVHCAMLPR